MSTQPSPDKPPNQPPPSSSIPIPPPSGAEPQGDLSLLRPNPMPMAPSTDAGLAQFVNDVRDIVPPLLQRSSWAYSANLVGLGAYSPRLAEAMRHRYKEYIQYLKMRYPRNQITPEYSLWLNNLRLLGVIQTSRATRPDTERRLLTLQTSEVINTPVVRGQRKKFLGLI
jgi:hypothetical protein